MKVNVAIMADGTVKLAVPSGCTFEQAKPILDKLAAELGREVGLIIEGEAEHHRHDPDMATVKHTHRATV